jgi:hypothetical protein
VIKSRPKRRPLDRRRLQGSLRRRALIVEPLEYRALLSAISVLDTQFAEPALSALAAVTNTSPRGYTPAQIRQAYSFGGITFNGSVQGDGSGQTIAIIDAYNDPNIASDLQAFDAAFGLANPPKFTVMNQNGGTSLPASDAGWSQEIALDVEWSHAMAPGANILLVEANSSSLSDLLAAVNTARNAAGVSVVSMSWGSGEFSGERQFDQYFTTPSGHAGVSFVASAGDSGAQAIWPAVSPNVLSVGGTSLSASGSSAGETAWSGSGGGYSRFEAEPGFQTSVQSSGVRTSPDVSFNANPNTGFAVYDSVAVGGRNGWFEIGGTSAGAPQWAALVAIANQGRLLAGKPTLAGAQSNLYSLASSDFRDVTSGSNGYLARVGYDLVTGRGSPLANLIVHDLVGNSAVSPAPTTGGQTTTTTTTPTSPVTTQPAPVHYRYELVYWNHRWWLVPVSSADAIDAGDNTDTSNSVASAISTNASAAESTQNPSPALATFAVATQQVATSTASQPASDSQAAVQAALEVAPELSMSVGALGDFDQGDGSSERDALPEMPKAQRDDAHEQDDSDRSETAPAEQSARPRIGTEAIASDYRGEAFHRFVAGVGSSADAVGAVSPNISQDSVHALAAVDNCFVDDDWLGELPEMLPSDSRTAGLGIGLGFLAATLVTGRSERRGSAHDAAALAARRYFNRVRRERTNEFAC